MQPSFEDLEICSLKMDAYISSLVSPVFSG